jgi:hypothetical protein
MAAAMMLVIVWDLPVPGGPSMQSSQLKDLADYAQAL